MFDPKLIREVKDVLDRWRQRDAIVLHEVPAADRDLT